MTSPKNMTIMRLMRQIPGLGGLHLFCSWNSPTKQILNRPKGVFCLILPHVPHVLDNCLNSKAENMTIMRKHEEGLFIGFYLPHIKRGSWSRPKHEAVMRQHEDDPHVFGENVFQTHLQSCSYYSSLRRSA